jgi:hypothetical protein
MSRFHLKITLELSIALHIYKLHDISESAYATVIRYKLGNGSHSAVGRLTQASLDHWLVAYETSCNLNALKKRNVEHYVAYTPVAGQQWRDKQRYNSRY